MESAPPIPHDLAGEGGLPLRVWEYPGDGPGLLLCHCTGTMGRMWEPVIQRLGGRFHVFAPDARGHGDSAKPPAGEAYAWERAGADVLAILEGLGGRAPRLAAGHSGGAASIAFAGLMAPGVFDRQLWLDAIVGPRHVFAGENPLAVMARRRKDWFPGRDAARERYAAKPPMARWTPCSLDAFLAHGLAADGEGVRLKCPPAVEAEIYNRGGAWAVYERLEEMRIPVLLATGEESNVRPLAEAQAERLPGRALRVLAGVSHFIPQEAPEETARLLLEWFGRAEG